MSIGRLDPLEEALGLVEDASKKGIPLRLAGGLAVRALCPAFPPRRADRQDLDLASVGRARPPLTQFLTGRGYVPDKQFNALDGHKQLFFSSPETGRTVDVLIDKLEMCHLLEFRDRIERMPHTLDPCDLLLSKLQIVELTQKDAQDALHLLAAFPVRVGDEPGTIGLGRFGEVVGGDWGWWRTVTLNLDRITELAADPAVRLAPPNPPFDPLEQIGVLKRAAQEVPKSLRWRLRAKVGQRVRWYRIPEETQHL